MTKIYIIFQSLAVTNHQVHNRFSKNDRNLNERVRFGGSESPRGIVLLEPVSNEEPQALDEDGHESRVGSFECGLELQQPEVNGDDGVRHEAAELADGLVDDIRGSGSEAVGNGAPSRVGFRVEVVRGGSKLLED